MQITESKRPVAASFLAAIGISNEPGTRTTWICSSVEPLCVRASSAPASSRSVIKLLNWLTTMPKRSPVALNSPRTRSGFAELTIHSPPVNGSNFRSCYGRMSWSGERHKRVAAVLVGFLETGLGAIDPFGDAILGIVTGARRCLGHNRACAEAAVAPRGMHGAGYLTKLFGEHTRVLERCVRQDECERPSGVFDGDVRLTNRRG